MKKILIICLSMMFVNAKVISLNELKKDGFVIMLGWDSVLEEATVIADRFPDDDVFIYLDNNKYTVRVVNIPTLPDAKQRLKEIKKVMPSAIMWKKMGWLLEQNQTVEKTQQIITLPQTIKEANISTVIFVAPKTIVTAPEHNTTGKLLLTKKIKIIADLYTAPLPMGKKIKTLQKEEYIQGIYSKQSDWFIVVKSASVGSLNNWSTLLVPLWVKSSCIE